MKWIVISLVILVIAILIINKSRKSYYNVKGDIGELRVNEILKSLPGKYKSINDVMIYSKNNYSQIDHIVIGPKGIVVIETKNYSGFIYGKESDMYWTQILGSDKNRFYNPIKQNHGHIKALTNALSDEFEDIPMFSLIVFVGNAKLKRIKSDIPVIYLKKLRKKIKRVKGRKVLSKSDIKEIKKYLEKINIHDKSAKRKHVKYINKISN